MLLLSYCESLELDCNISPLMDIKMGVCVVESHWGMCVVCGVFAGIHILMCTYQCVWVRVCAYGNVFFCICMCVLCWQVSGPLVDLIEFMDQQALYPTLSESLVIELTFWHEQEPQSPGCSDYFAGTLHVITSMAECLPELVHHADRFP